MSQISASTKSQFHAWAKDFEAGYLLESVGQRHIAAYGTERGNVRKHWLEAKAAKAAKQDITDLVLYKLLPYSNTHHNRDMGHNISATPAITKDIKTWFEKANWQKAENWPLIAEALYRLISSLIEKDDWSAFDAFAANGNLSKGFKTGIVTPTLHALQPSLWVVNSKTIDTVNLLLGEETIGRELTDYKHTLAVVRQALDALDVPLFHDIDVFDAFCHWMCAKRLGGYARLNAEPEPDAVVVQPLYDNEMPPQNHWEAIYYIVKCGNLLGYKTYVADPSRTAFGHKLSEVATLSTVPAILNAAPEIARVDAIWFRHTPPFFLFEVEDGGTMREALLRLYNTMAFDARRLVVCPSHNRDKFDKWVKTAPFKEYEERYLFRTYDELFAYYKAAGDYTEMRSQFLKVGQ